LAEHGSRCYAAAVYGRSDRFNAFHSRISLECDALEAEILAGSYSPREPNRVLVEKSKGLCRQVVILNVRDALVLQCLSDAFYANIKGKAPSKTAFFEPERHVFFGPLNEKRTYGSFRSWLEFQRHIFNFSKLRKYIVVTDITNFYDYISHAHLRNIVTDYVEGVKESILDLLIFILSELNWNPDYMPRAGIGLPQIDLDAPRLLANCFLYELDKMLVRQSSLEYVRFMDDIDIGVDTIPKAKEILRDIDLTLHSRQVRLNSGKTKILSSSEAREHFKISENEEINSLEVAAENSEDVREGLNALLLNWFEEKRFDTGNGEKILKRLMNLATKYKSTLPAMLIDDCLFRRPAVRESIYRYMCYSSPNMDALHSILEYLESDYAVDDASYVEFTNCLVDSTCKLDQSATIRIQALIECMTQRKTDAMLYCVFKLMSKMGYIDLMPMAIESTFDNWKVDYLLGRVVGAMWPVIKNTAYEDKFKSLLISSRNIGAREVYNYLIEIGNHRQKFMSVRGTLRAPNKSFPNRITHGKFILLHSALHGQALDDAEKQALRGTHQFAARDPFYAGVLQVAG
jgi:hypothetical protein